MSAKDTVLVLAAGIAFLMLLQGEDRIAKALENIKKKIIKAPSEAPAKVEEEIEDSPYWSTVVETFQSQGAGKVVEVTRESSTGEITGITFENAIADVAHPEVLGLMTVTETSVIYSPSGKVPEPMTEAKFEAFSSFMEEHGRAPTSSEWAEITGDSGGGGDGGGDGGASSDSSGFSYTASDWYWGA